MTPDERYYALHERISATTLADLAAKADSNLRPVLDAAGDDLVSVSVEPYQDPTTCRGGRWEWSAMVIARFASGISIGDFPVDLELRLVDGAYEIVSAGCDPCDARSAIRDIQEDRLLAA